ncbi:phage tail protein [Serratia sp. BFP-2025]|uniref:phage tail protein n=1 Tax=Serratia sp. BFP-2025 TaxID=3433707 RepID=UPI003D7EABF1
MADDKLKTPVEIQQVRVDASILPLGFSQAYKLYVIQSGFDLGNTAAKANQAAGGAYDAQQKNDDQDKVLNQHAQRIGAAERTLADHGQRLSRAESEITSQGQRLTAAENDIAAQGDAIELISADYISKSVTAPQTLSSPLNVALSYSVGGVQVVGPRQTGWTAATGTAFLGGFDADAAFSAGVTYSQAEIKALADALKETRQRVKALEDMARAHGMID